MLYPTIRHRSAPARYRRPSNDFDQVFRHLFGSEPEIAGVNSPAVDVSETDEGFAVAVDLPGFDAADVEVSIENDILTIEGSRTEVEEKKEGRYHISERKRGKFRRTFTLPDLVDSDAVEGKLSNGVLQLTLPKLPQAKPKKVAVKLEA